MKITLFGAIWIVLIIMCVCRKKLDNIISVLFFSSVFQCNNVIVWGENGGVGPFAVTSLFFIINYFLLVVKKGDRTNKSKEKMNFGIILIAISIIISIVFNIRSIKDSIIMKLLPIVTYFVCFGILKKIGSYVDFKVDKVLIRMTDFVLVVGVLQFLISMSVIPKNYLVETFLYNDRTNTNIAYYATSKVRLFSTFMEPSFCAGFLLAMLIYCMQNIKEQKNVLIRCFIIVLELVLTFSTTAYVGLFLCLVIFLLTSEHKRIVFRCIPIFLVVILVLLFSGALNEVVFNKATTDSAGTREIWNRLAIKSFESSPVYGVGYKRIRASSLFYSIMGQLGVIGLIAYIIFLIEFIRKIFYNKIKNKSVIYMILAVSICQIISIPDLDFCVFWLILYIYAITLKCEKSITV